MRSYLLIAAVAVLALALPTTSTGTVSHRAFQKCGDYPADFTYHLRVEGVSCSRGKKVSERYYRTTVNEQDDDVSFGSWRCNSKSYGDGGNVKCKKGSDEVRFAMGG
jgi:hypothetical protein